MAISTSIFESIRRAQALIEVARYQEAGEILALGLGEDPANYDLLCLMAQVHLGERRTKDAHAFVEKAIAAEPERAWAYRIQSIVLRAGLRRHDSVAAAKEAVRLAPNDPANWQTLAQSELQIFNLPEARAAAEKMREIAPEWYLSHQTLALVAMKEERFKDAEEHCRRELQLNPLSYHGMNNLGVVFSHQKRKRAAVEAFHAAARMNSVEALARENLTSAVSSYLPKIGLGFGGFWLLFQLLRILAGLPGREWITGIVLVAVLLAAAGYFFLRWFRWYRMPAEVRRYYDLVKKRSRLPARSKVLFVVWVGALVLLGLWCVVVWSFWGDFKKTWDYFELAAFPALTVMVAVGSFAAYLFAWKRETKVED